MKSYYRLFSCAFLFLFYCFNVFFVKADEKEIRQVDGKYYLNHFWDSYDFGNPSCLDDTVAIEQSFVDFIYVLKMGNEDVRRGAIKNLNDKIENNKAANERIETLANKYLYEISSPMLNEGLYSLFLQTMLQNPVNDDLKRMRMQWLIDDIKKNPIGGNASDFEFETREGNKKKLYDVKSERLILIFYDPDCLHCREVMKNVSENRDIISSLKKEEIKVVAISSGTDKNKWREHSMSLPGEWIVGYEPGMIEDEEIYVFRSSPTIYILDSLKVVTDKEAQRHFEK